MRRGGLAREWPLVGFTLLTQTAVGAFWSLAAADASLGGPSLDRRALTAILIIGGTGTLLSLFHLGKPARAANALANLRSSWISREILADILFLFACSALWILAAAGDEPNALRTGLIVFGAATGIVLIYSMSRIYMLRTVPVWKGPHTPVSFFLSAAFLGPLAASILTLTRGDDLGFYESRILVAAALAVAGLIFVAVALFAPSFGFLVRTQATLLAFPPGKTARFIAARTVLLLAASACLFVFLIRSAEGFLSLGALIAACLAALGAEITGRALFYAMYSRLGV